MKPGPRNLITDVSGLLVGNAHDDNLKSGCTVLIGDAPLTTGVHVMGGAPGTRETDLLAPDRLVEQVDAIVLSGGSAFGLDAAGGVADALREQGRGFAVGPARVPIVPAAILFDLLNGGDKNWAENPYRALGASALGAASRDFCLGTQGAGTGATAGQLKGGLGSTSLVLDNGITVGALVAANPMGEVISGKGGQFWAAPMEIDQEFGGRGIAYDADPLSEPDPFAKGPARTNTTLAIVATDAALTQAQATRMAIAAHDGMARAIFPSHTPYDGDIVFAVSTGTVAVRDPARDPLLLGHAAAICLSRAIARAVWSAEPTGGDVFPTWKQSYG